MKYHINFMNLFIVLSVVLGLIMVGFVIMKIIEVI